MKFSTALPLVLDDLREQQPDRYDHLDDLDAYREWTNDGPTTAEIDEAERGRQLDTRLADAYRLVLTVSYGPVMTVLLGDQEQADAVDDYLQRAALVSGGMGSGKTVAAHSPLRVSFR